MTEGLNLAEPSDITLDIGSFAKDEVPERSPLGAGYVILVARELTGLSQRSLARSIGTSQPALARLETGNRMPSVRTLLRIADAAGLDLTLGLRRHDPSEHDPAALEAMGFALIGTLHLNPEDGLADFTVLREPSVFEGPPDL